MKYRVTLRRLVGEEARLEVDAEDEIEAEELASRSLKESDWERDYVEDFDVVGTKET